MSKVDAEAIVEALKAGESQNAVARRLGCGAATVNRIAKRNGLEYSAPKNLSEARKDYAAAERLALLNKGFAKAEELLPGLKTAGWLQSWSIAVGILIDKRRLEDGEATSRTEINGDAVREQLTSRLDELTRRRREKGAA